MADTDAHDIQRQMDEIQAAMSGGFRVSPTQTVESALAEREHVVELQRRYQELATKLPKTGSQAGVLEIVGRRVSSGFLPPPEPSAGRDEEVWDNPLLRFLKETGQSWE